MTDPKFPIPEVPKSFGVEQPKIEPLPAFVHPPLPKPEPLKVAYTPRSTAVPTVKIFTPSGENWCLVNSVDFNPHQHRLWVEPATDQA